jgi:choline dehydrogenase
MERGRAVGVEVRRGTARETIRATRAVLLCAEPVRAAQLLMLSGIGPADHLRAMGVPVVADRPGVGANLQTHLRVALRWQALAPALALPASTVSAGLFTVSLAASPPDLQMDLLDPAAAAGPTLGLDVTLVQPASRGTVRLRSANHDEAPLVSPRPLAADADVTALVQGVRLGRFIMSGPQLDRFRGEEDPDTREAQSQAQLEALVRASARPMGHVAGTCAMGRASDRAAVVDASLAAHGVAGLHVAGASVMPVVVNAPPAAACLMIGERAADLVLSRRSTG